MARISIGLYGLGTRNCHLKAETIICDHCEHCSLYKEGKCFNRNTFGSVGCSKGEVEHVDLGTNQRKDFAANKIRIQKDPKYFAVEYPHNKYVFEVDNEIGLCIPHARVKYDEKENQFEVDDALFFRTLTFIPNAEFTASRLNQICTYKPCTWGGGEIKEYQEKIVPELLRQIKQLNPNFYETFIQLHPEYSAKISGINYIGRKAFLKTCNLSAEFVDNSGNKYHVINDKILSGEVTKSFSPFGAKNCSVRVPITDDLIVTITDNSQVLETTKFV